MTAQDFVYWLNGFVELGGDKTPPTETQWKSIVAHLSLTMVKVTPPVGQATQEEAKQGSIQKLVEDYMKQRELDRKVDKQESGVVPTPFIPHTYPSDRSFPYYDPFKYPQFPTWDNQPLITC